MADLSPGPSSFLTQADALLRKNLTFQKRNKRANIRIILFPVILCLLLAIVQELANKALGKVQTNCGSEPPTLEQIGRCPTPNPPEWPATIQVPRPEYRAVRTDSIQSTDLPRPSCRKAGACPVTILLTGHNHSLGSILAGNMFLSSFTLNPSNITGSLDNFVLGSASEPRTTNFLESAFLSDDPIYYVRPRCRSHATFPASFSLLSTNLTKEVQCIKGLNLWRNSSSEINGELFKGYYKGNSRREINEIAAAYDFLNSNHGNFNVTIWYNSTYNDEGDSSASLVRVPRLVNMVSNAYLRLVQGNGVKIILDFIKEMPKRDQTTRNLDLSSLLGSLFFSWVILQLFPIVLTSLVYEKQQKLRIMMKMHGLGDGPYWMISYAYFLIISFIYMLCFVTFGSLIGLKLFSSTNYSLQFVFYFFYINLQISLAFLVAAVFSDVKTASVLGYIFVFGTGLLGGFLFQYFIQDTSFPYGWIIIMELYPGFSLYRGLYEFSQYSLTGSYIGTDGMQWKDLSDNTNGMKDVLIIMFVEWWIVLFVAYYIDQVVSSGSGVRRNPLFFLEMFQKKKPTSSLRRPSLDRQGSKVFVPMEKADVSQEREKVEKLLLEGSPNHAIICDNLRRVYPGRDGNPEKIAVQGLSLAVPHGECFGMLGPNGAGKTSFISMMIGLTEPTSGTAFIEGLDLRTEMDVIYTRMGVCPQHDLLWETLTGREHLLFYGRLKNLKGAVLTQAVEESLKSLNLFHGGLADKQAGRYSGGMKRRLSVAISLIGDPKVVYMDEPSTGLDPAARNYLWNVVKNAKQGRAIILTTHSMEEAEYLCDRLGIFVDGNLQCVGNSNELKARYGGSYVFTMTTTSDHEEEVERLVLDLSPNANKIYQISGTLKFELPKHEVRIADVFKAVENAKSRFAVRAWGLADTTLEDVFIKVARTAQAFNVVS